LLARCAIRFRPAMMIRSGDAGLFRGSLDKSSPCARGSGDALSWVMPEFRLRRNNGHNQTCLAHCMLLLSVLQYCCAGDVE
jgi:hypothetical protein